MKGVYLLHFDDPIEHAQHYIGYSKNLCRRMKEHRSGKGSPLVKVTKGKFSIVRIWKDKNIKFERKLHNYKNSRKLCPICSGNIAFKRMKS